MPKTFEGKSYLGLREASRFLKIPMKDVKKLIGSGDLDYFQPRVNAPIYICLLSCQQYIQKKASQTVL